MIDPMSDYLLSAIIGGLMFAWGYYTGRKFRR